MAPSANPVIHRTSNFSDRERRERRRAAAFGEYRQPDETAGASGIVLAGVAGWGGGAFERLLRGPLLAIAQEPLVSYPLRWLRAGGVRAAAVCAGSATSVVRERFGGGASLNMSLQYYEDSTPRGPAGCARDAALSTAAERFVVVEGAFIPTLDLRALLAAHRASGAAATTVVEFDRRRSQMRHSQPARPGGIYVFERHVLERVPAAGFQDIKQGLLERLYAHGEKVAVHEVAGLSPRVLDFHSYASVSSWLITSAVSRRAAAREQEMVGAALETLWLEGAEDEFHVIDAPLPKDPGARRAASRHELSTDARSFVPFAEWEQVDDALVHPTAAVHPSARLIGPVLVGPYACVEADAVIVGPTSLGAGAVVEADAVVARSELLARVRVGAGAQVDGSVVADGVVVASQRHVAGAVLTGPTRMPTAPAAVSTPKATAASTRPTSMSAKSPISRIPVSVGSSAAEGSRRPAGPIALSPLHTPPS